MDAPVASILTHSREALDALRRTRGIAAPPEDWRARIGALPGFGLTSIEKLRDAGEQHRLAALIGAGSAARAAGAVYAVRASARLYADVLTDEQPSRITTLDDLRDDEDALSLIQRELLAEWGHFAPRDMDAMRRMVRNAGRLVFVIRFYEDGVLGPPSGLLQTGLVDAAGDPGRLRAAYSSFEAISAHGTWEASPDMRGDTAMLLQITAFGDRSRGVGSRLRDTALYMLGPSVRYALTTTPVPEGFTLDSDPESSPATRFHYRGGARAAGYAAAFKTPAAVEDDAPPGRQSNRDVVFMRYQRLESGDWDGVMRPEMRIRHHSLEAVLPDPIRHWRPHLPLRPAASPAIAA